MKPVIITIFFFVSFITFAQKTSRDDIKTLSNKEKMLEAKNAALTAEVNALKVTVANLKKIIDSLKSQTKANSDAINKTALELGVKISNTEETTNQKILSVDNESNNKWLWAIIGVLLALLLSGLLYWLLNRTKLSIGENLVKEFGKQTGLMDMQMEFIKLQKRITPDDEPDHSMALKVANEINLIERNIQLMDVEAKGFKQLTRSVEKLRDNLAANGYEIPQLLGKPFHHGMNVIIANSMPDEKLAKGTEVISKILVPLVNYNGKMIQTAQIEVSVG